MSPNDTSQIILIPLSQDYFAIVDEIDADLFFSKWSVKICANDPYYAIRNIRTVDEKHTTESMHRIILSRKLGRNLLKNELVDHINGDGLDNRRDNLRVASPSENSRNQRRKSSNKSGFKGVCWHKYTKKWTARITVEGKQKSLGYFDTPEDAYEAYCKEAIEKYGKYARLD